MSAVSLQGWGTALLGELCDVSIGRTPARERRDFWGQGSPWLSIADMNQGRDLKTTAETITDVAVRECNCRLVPKGTVLLSFKLSIGKVGITQRALFTNEAIAALPIRDSSRLQPEFLYWALRSINLTLGLDRAAKGLTLNKEKLFRVRVPLPPLPEQQRIARILDKADWLRARRGTVFSQLDSLAQSVFLDMFGDPTVNPKGWPIKRLDELCQSIKDIDHKMPAAVDDGVPFISAKDLTDDGRISFENVKRISPEDFRRLSRKSKPQKGDIIYSRIGANLGKARVVEVDLDFLASYSCCTIKPNLERVDVTYLCKLLDSPSILRQAHKGVRAIAVPDLGMAEIKAFKIIVPPLALQREFARRIEAIDKTRATNRTSEAELAALFASLQDRAFRGEL